MEAIFQEGQVLPPLSLAMDVMSTAGQTDGGKLGADTYKERKYSYTDKNGISGISLSFSTREGPTGSQS